MTEPEYSEKPMLPSWFISLVAAGLLIVIAVQGKAFLMPLVVAALISVLVAAVAERIVQVTILGWRLPWWMALSFSFLLIALGTGVVVAIVYSQASDLPAAIARYTVRLDGLIAEFTEYFGEHKVTIASDVVKSINLQAMITGLIGSAGLIITGFSLVVIYCIFMISERDLFLKKLHQIFPKRDDIEAVATAIALSVRRYILVKTLTSLITGFLSYIVLKWIGVDFAETWALLIFFLNFIPSIGSIVATIFPVVLTLLQFDTITPFLIVTLSIVTIQFVIGQFVEPTLMGRSLNLSPFVIILALTFWGNIWGVQGMFLSVPITVVITIFCSHIGSLNWIAVLLSRDINVTACISANPTT